MSDDSAILVNGIPVSVPEKGTILGATRSFELQSPEIHSKGYKVKHFGLYVFEDGSNLWSGISYYRKGMKIGEIDIKDVPKSIASKFWGYVEVEEHWEDDLSDIEDKVHFGVSKGKKMYAAYQNLRIFCNTKTKANFIEWGYIKDKENADKKLRDELRAIADDIQDLFDKLGFEDLGKGAQRSDFDVRLQNIAYPVVGTEEVTVGDKISFSLRIKSTYITDKKFDYKVSIIDPRTGTLVSQIAKIY